MLWSSLATAKLKASMGFQEIELDASRRIVFDKGEEVRRSYNTMERSVAAEARIEVSVWLKAKVVIVSAEVGQCKVCSGVADDLERSYTEMTLDEAAKVEKDRWWDTPVYPAWPRYVAKGGAPAGLS